MKFYDDHTLGIDPTENYQPRILSPEEIATMMLESRLETATRLGNVQEVRRVLRLKIAFNQGQLTPSEVFAEVLDGVVLDSAKIARREEQCLDCLNSLQFWLGY